MINIRDTREQDEINNGIFNRNAMNESHEPIFDIASSATRHTIFGKNDMDLQS